ncbi:MAG: 5'/3'-nucleotidase SurE [Desertifilum sp.]|nr:5'/3'-nucleotidase SurE [Desertifilum sp.]
MTLILTNDDGIDAPGIQALQQAVSQKAAIVAPLGHYSGCGHQVTTTRPIAVEKRSPSTYGIQGTPADCTRLALTQLFPDAQCVLSGINAGGNLGVDVYISGTVAAVREAALLGVPGIAISHYIKKGLPIDWEFAAQLTAGILAELLSQPWEPGTFWNVNLPHLAPDADSPELVFCQPCKQPLPVNYRVEGNEYYYVGKYSDRPLTPGSDVEVCFSGNVAITQLKL